MLRDPIRLAFALLGSVLLMFVFGFGISLDVRQLHFTVLDHDRRAGQPRLSGAPFELAISGNGRPLIDHPGTQATGCAAASSRWPSDSARFGADLAARRRQQSASGSDGAMPSRAETSLGYLEGVPPDLLD